MCGRLHCGMLYGKPGLLCVANLFERLGLQGGWWGGSGEVLPQQLRSKWVVASRAVRGVAPFGWLLEWRLGVADDGCWSCRRKLRVSCGACCAKTGKVSAQEAQ